MEETGSFSSSLAYISAVEKENSGLQITNQHKGSLGSFRSCSPLPRTIAVTLRTQKGTSLPSSAAIRSKSFIIISGR